MNIFFLSSLLTIACSYPIFKGQQNKRLVKRDHSASHEVAYLYQLYPGGLQSQRQVQPLASIAGVTQAVRIYYPYGYVQLHPRVVYGLYQLYIIPIRPVRPPIHTTTPRPPTPTTTAKPILTVRPPAPPERTTAAPRTTAVPRGDV